MRLAGIVAVCFLVVSSSGALAEPAAPPAGQAAPAQTQAGVHRVGDAFDYTIHGSVAQAITAHDPLGQRVQQPATPTALDGREHVAIQQISQNGITLERSGLIVAVVPNAKPEKRLGKGLTLVRDDGSIARDTGNLGGAFLLPLPFLGDRSMNAGSDLAAGARWTEKLGTKLYGMTARPTMTFEVTGQHLVLGVDVFEIDAEGSAPMREPIVSNTGESLGYATGTAHITMHGEYDRINRRMIAMQVQVRDSLHLSGPNKHNRGVVGDEQQYVLELDPASIAAQPALQSDSTTVTAPLTH